LEALHRHRQRRGGWGAGILGALAIILILIGDYSKIGSGNAQSHAHRNIMEHPPAHG
jgi:hypothetical protein